MSTMSLPDEQLVSIFGLLDLTDLIQCRLVSRKWKFFVDKVRLNELIIDFESGNARRQRRRLDPVWYNSHDLIKQGNRINLNVNRQLGTRFRLVRMQLMMPMFLELRRMRLVYLQRIYGHSDKDSQALFLFILEKLFAFRKLEQLELVITDDVLMQEHWKIQHPTLNTLYLDYAREKVNHFTIDCPQLFALHWSGHFARVAVKRPDSIGLLEGDFLYNFEGPLDLSLYVNLECFRFSGFPNDLSEDFFVSNSSPFFSEFHYDVTLKILDQDFKDLDHFIVIVNRLFADMKRLNRDEFRFFLDGQQLNEDQFAAKIEQYKLECEVELELQKQRQSRLASSRELRSDTSQRHDQQMDAKKSAKLAKSKRPTRPVRSVKPVKPVKPAKSKRARRK